MTTTITLPTPQSAVYRYSCITRRWWLNGGKEDVQDLMLAIALSMVANYFYYVDLALGLTVKAAKAVVEYAPNVWQLATAAGYALWIKSEAGAPVALRKTRAAWVLLNDVVDDGLGVYGPSPMLQQWTTGAVQPVEEVIESGLNPKAAKLIEWANEHLKAAA